MLEIRASELGLVEELIGVERTLLELALEYGSGLELSDGGPESLRTWCVRAGLESLARGAEV